MSRRWNWRRKYGVVLQLQKSKDEAGVRDICHEHGISMAEAFEWKMLVKVYGPLGLRRASPLKKETLHENVDRIRGQDDDMPHSASQSCK